MVEKTINANMLQVTKKLGVRIIRDTHLLGQGPVLYQHLSRYDIAMLAAAHEETTDTVGTISKAREFVESERMPPHTNKHCAEGISGRFLRGRIGKSIFFVIVL
jgi:hypothetical protein